MLIALNYYYYYYLTNYYYLNIEMSTGKRVWRAVINHVSMVTMATAELIIIIMSPYATGLCSFVTSTETA